MNFFHVYTNESGNTAYAQDGFSLGAFLFVFFYTLFRGLWLFSFVIFCASCLSYALYSVEVLSFQHYFLIELLVKLYAGFSYTDWRKKKLQRKKYKLFDVVLAHDAMHAKLQFMKRKNRAARSSK